MRTGGLETQLSMDDAWARDGEWCEAAAIWLYVRPIGATFSADDVTAALGRPHGSGNAIGAVFRAAAKRGEISCVGFTPSTRPDRHRNMVRIWERA